MAPDQIQKISTFVIFLFFLCLPFQSNLLFSLILGHVMFYANLLIVIRFDFSKQTLIGEAIKTCISNYIATLTKANNSKYWQVRRQLKHISKYSKYWNSTSKTTGDINNSLLHFASKMCTTYTNIRFLLDTEVVIKCSMKWKLKFHLVNVKSSLQFLTLFIHYSFFHMFKCENLVLPCWSTDIQEAQLA